MSFKSQFECVLSRKMFWMLQSNHPESMQHCLLPECSRIVTKLIKYLSVSWMQKPGLSLPLHSLSSHSLPQSGTQQTLDKYLIHTCLLDKWITKGTHHWILIELLAPACGSRLLYILIPLTTSLIYLKKGPFVLPTTSHPVVIDTKLEFGDLWKNQIT